MTTTPSPLAFPLDSSLRPMLESLSRLEQAVLVVDRCARVVWASDSLGLFCDTPSVYTGRFIQGLLANRSQLDGFRRELLAHGRVAPCTIEVRLDGARRRVEVSAVLLPASQAEPLFLVTARRADRLEAAQRPQEPAPEASLPAIFDSSPEAILTLDSKGLVTYANPAVSQLLGCAPEDVVSQPLTRLLLGSDNVGVPFPATSDGETRDVTLSRGDGTTLHVSVSASPLTRGEATNGGTLAFLRDVTEQRSKAAEVARKNAELESYVHSVSHDLRSPLVSLLGFSRLLRQDHADQLGDSGRHFLDRIEQAGRTMEALINDLLELSRIGETAARKTVVDPQKTLIQLRGELKPRLESQGVELEICDRPPLVFCDRIRLYQVFSNLVGNALDHMGPHPKPRIEIDVREEPEVHHVTVRDNGRGIDPKHHERIFEIFQSLGPRADGRRGTGVGLAIVKKIAETHGGRVWVESAPGEGACFHLTFPRR